ncbi:MAG: diacylglycerol kinase family lipid kinase [Clostridia bacterium]|nr:diacylglycerol kinase family lipid kinase [Clostridia bacterium]
MENRNMLLLYNPAAGKGRADVKIAEMAGVFESHGWSVDAVPTMQGEAVFGQIKECSAGKDMIVTVGGDGTLALTVNGMLKNGIDIPLGYVPMGSTNDFGKSIGLSGNAIKTCERIAQGGIHPTDIGLFNGRYFVYIAAAGLFADASYATSPKLKKVFGHGAYLMTGLSTVPQSAQKNAFYRVETDEGVYEHECLFISASNSFRAGGVLNLPKDDISFSDGKFELLMVLTPKNFIDGATMLKDVLNSDFGNDDCVYLKSSRFRITANTPVPWSLDGENGGEHSEADISVVPGAIKFVY